VIKVQTARNLGDTTGTAVRVGERTGRTMGTGMIDRREHGAWRSRALVALLISAVSFGPLPLLTATPAQAQDDASFAVRVTVDGAVITDYEVQQRALFLRALRLPGDPESEAIRALIEDRLGATAAKAAGITVKAEDITAGMTEFAGRANLSPEDFTKALADEGVAPETFRDFVTAGLLWRAVVRAKFPGTQAVSAAQVDRAIAGTVNKPLIRILMSELFLPLQPGDDPAAILEEARAIKAEIENSGSFGAAARQYSAAPTGQNGGRLDWMDLTNLPAPVAEKLLKLAPGKVSEPFVLPNAVALFQLNNLSEEKGPAPAAVQVEYAEYLLAPGQDAASVRAQVDRCGDLNIVARGQGAERLTVTKTMTSALPQDVALELAKLDAGEASTALRRGEWTVFLMLCQRQALAEAPPPPEADPAAPAAAATPDPETAEDDGLPEGMIAPVRAAVQEQLASKRLEQLAAGYMEELRSEARIDIK
jgi:peptidyl-prolyl cis-trans isomerase SurA